MGTDPAVTEIWTEYAVGTVLIIARTFSRVWTVGFRGFKADDYFVILAWAFYSSLATLHSCFVLINQGANTSLLVTEADRLALPVTAHHSYEWGTKLYLAALFCIVGVCWSFKLCMLFFYKRAVKGLWMEKLIYPIVGLVVVSWVICYLVLALGCQPFRRYWQILPDPGSNCTPRSPINYFTILSLGLLTDFIILLIPIPIVISVQNVSPARRAGLWFLFTLGIFCMIAAILRIYFVFSPRANGATAIIWAMREVFVSCAVNQIPMVYPAFKRKFWSREFTTVSSGRGSSSGGSRSRKSYFRQSSSPIVARFSSQGSATRGASTHELSQKSPQSSGAAAALTGSRRSALSKVRDPYSLTALDLEDCQSDSEGLENTPQDMRPEPKVWSAVEGKDQEDHGAWSKGDENV